MTVLLAAVVLTAAAVAFVLSARKLAAARREAERIRATFARYLPPVVVADVLEPAHLQRLNGRSGYATILVCRIWGFALFAEVLGAEETRRYLGDLYALASRTVAKHGGLVDKFLADGVVAAFGFPLEDQHHEEHAVRAALEMTRLLDALHARWAAPGRPRPRSGIGIHSGTVVAGDVGDPQRRDFRLVGLAPLAAGRLQEHTEPMRAFIIASETTLKPVFATFSTVAAQTVPLRGMKQNLKAFVVRGLAPKTPEPATPSPPAPAQKAPRPSLRTRAVRPIPQRRRRPAQAGQAPSLNIPELRGFRALDGTAARPDIVIVEGYYEDDSGRPPVKLPP
ncbi:MAG: adenylate/guanylate cyclase domain-containing protein [Candidatus Eremiobacteraeota bacterium]|nr:adenylate/guanylate cyclase domain-containing protein [Candidatus Eremiobacteraeota bacterium]MBV8356036.1 adenylate/guanylate cyclase domain-containing protein [Candidatus Eremiobacteraeota bacterium]